MMDIITGRAPPPARAELNHERERGSEGEWDEALTWRCAVLPPGPGSERSATGVGSDVNGGHRDDLICL